MFQYKYISSLKRSLPSLLRRKNVLDQTLKNMLLHEQYDTAKMINLYAIMKTDRLFFEFMDEVIREKLHQEDLSLEKKDVNMFFIHKAEQSSKVASFNEQTVQKLQMVHQRILYEAGILVDKQKGLLYPPLVDIDLKEHLQSLGEQRYLYAMGV